jgi:hypothetical protein
VARSRPPHRARAGEAGQRMSIQLFNPGHSP